MHWFNSINLNKFYNIHTMQGDPSTYLHFEMAHTATLYQATVYKLDFPHILTKKNREHFSKGSRRKFARSSNLFQKGIIRSFFPQR